MSNSPESIKPSAEKESVSETVDQETTNNQEMPEVHEPQGSITETPSHSQQTQQQPVQQVVTKVPTQTITISIPATPTQLLDWSKGAPSESLTWFALFWLRMIKKAVHYGWRVVVKGGVA
jgi:hypothetical protein